MARRLSHMGGVNTLLAPHIKESFLDSTEQSPPRIVFMADGNYLQCFFWALGTLKTHENGNITFDNPPRIVPLPDFALLCCGTIPREVGWYHNPPN